MPESTVLLDVSRLLAGFVLVVGLGLLLGRSAGLRGTALTLAAAPITLAAVSLLGAAQSVLPIPWRPLPVIGVLIGLAGLIWSARLGWRRIRPGTATRDTRAPGGWREAFTPAPTPWWIVGALAACTAVVGGVLLYACGGTFQTVSQTWDATFHTNVIRGIYQLGTAAPSRVGLAAYGAEGSTGFYPSGFASFASFVGQSVGLDPVPASNVASVLIGGAVWPAAVTVLARAVLGRGVTTTRIALLFALGSWAMPYSPMSFGVLWPTMCGYAVAPLLLAAALRLVEPMMDGAAPDPRAGAAAAGATVLVGVGQPRVLIIVGLFVWLAVMVSLVPIWRRARRRDDGVTAGRALAGAAVLIAALAAAGVVSRRFMSQAFQWVDWPIIESPLAIVFRGLINAPVFPYPGLIVAALSWFGCVLALRRPRLWWLPVCYVSAIVLEAVTATSRNGLVLAATRFWYADRWRVVPALPLFALPLAVLACSWLVSRVRSRVAGLRSGAGASAGADAGGALRGRPAWAMAVVVGLLVWAFGILNLPQRLLRLDDFYASAAQDPKISLVSPNEQFFYRRLTDLVPSDAVILNNPQDGSAFIYAYSGRRVAFPSPFVDKTDPVGSAAWLRTNLVYSTDHQAVCQTLWRLRIGYVFNGGRTFETAMFEPTPAPGMQIPDGFWATTPVASDGDLRLYRISGCRQAIALR